ncbi:MAG TPA: hypothetical protein VKA70_06230 [Blastocatellia bacterium]|nr:hypothetical protein [Blastocatellia bacterium]
MLKRTGIAAFVLLLLCFAIQCLANPPQQKVDTHKEDWPVFREHGFPYWIAAKGFWVDIYIIYVFIEPLDFTRENVEKVIADLARNHNHSPLYIYAFSSRDNIKSVFASSRCFSGRNIFSDTPEDREARRYFLEWMLPAEVSPRFTASYDVMFWRTDKGEQKLNWQLDTNPWRKRNQKN